MEAIAARPTKTPWGRDRQRSSANDNTDVEGHPLLTEAAQLPGPPRTTPLPLPLHVY